jgi:hypothetical protein
MTKTRTNLRDALKPFRQADSVTGPAPMCVSCTRFRRAALGLTCDAYPAGIPEGIYMNKVDHRVPQPGDRGLRYDPEPGAEEQEWWPKQEKTQ